MGYTHYWKLPKEISTNQWGEFKRDVQKIMKHPNIINFSKTQVEIGDEYISFNGDGPQAHETFMLERTGELRQGETRRSGFCKTARKQYDLLAVAVLLAAAHHISDIEVSSDGSAADWEPGAMVVRDACGYYDDPNKEE